MTSRQRGLSAARAGRPGYTTISATNGQEALEKVAAEAPDLILLDVMMPVMDGFTACRLLKDNETTQLIPIIIMTALRETEDRIKGIEAGADDFLSKPVDRRELIAHIQTAIKMKQVVDAKIEQTENRGQRTGGKRTTRRSLPLRGRVLDHCLSGDSLPREGYSRAALPRLPTRLPT